MYAYIENGMPVVGRRAADVGPRPARLVPSSGRSRICLAPLHETIPHFHDTPRRLEALERAVESTRSLARQACVQRSIGSAVADTWRHCW